MSHEKKCVQKHFLFKKNIFREKETKIVRCSKYL